MKPNSSANVLKMKSVCFSGRKFRRAFKGEAGAKEAGKMRAEGKEYVVKDGDVMNFLFNV